MTFCDVIRRCKEFGLTDAEAISIATKLYLGDRREISIYKVVKRKDKWCVVSHKTGKTFGCHDSRAEAEEQLRAIEANKNSK